jgi:hypothetical protein
MSQTPLRSSQLQLPTQDSAGGNPPLSVAIEIEPQPTDSYSENHPTRGISRSLLFAVAMSGLCMLNLIFGFVGVTIAELERRKIVPDLFNYSLTLVLMPYCMWIMCAVALDSLLPRCFSDIAPQCHGEELRALRRMLMHCVDGFMQLPVAVYFVVRVFLSKNSAEFYASSSIVARLVMMTGIILDLSELATFNAMEWTVAHHLGELIITLLCIEWVPGVGGRESALFILTLLNAFDRCAYAYFFLSELRFLREKYHRPSSTKIHTPVTVPEKSSEPVALSEMEPRVTEEAAAHAAKSNEPDLLLNMSNSTLRLLARVTFVYYVIFVRVLVLALLIAHLALKNDTMLLGWKIALIPAFFTFAAVDIPVYKILWKRSIG